MNDIVVRFSLQDETGAALNLTGCTLRFEVHRLTGGKVIQKTTGAGIVVVEPATSGVAEVTLTAADTNIEPGNYRCELLVVDQAGLRYTADQTFFAVKPALIKE